MCTANKGLESQRLRKYKLGIHNIIYIIPNTEAMIVYREI